MEKKNPILQFSLPKNHIPLIPEKIRQVGKLFEHCKSKTDKRNKETRKQEIKENDIVGLTNLVLL